MEGLINELVSWTGQVTFDMISTRDYRCVIGKKGGTYHLVGVAQTYGRAAANALLELADAMKRDNYQHTSVYASARWVVKEYKIKRNKIGGWEDGDEANERG